MAWAAGPCGIGETTLAGHLEPAYGPGDLDLADRGFPSREAAAAKIAAGKHFAWRVSSAWNLRRSGRPLPDGTWKAKITWRGRTVKVRVVEYHMDQVFDLPPGHPLLTSPPPGPSVRVLDGGHECEHDGGLCRLPPGTVRVEVSETVTIITSLMDTGTYPARDIAELYGMRWASELVYLEEKRTLSGGQPVTAATPAGAYRMAAATVAAHQALRIAGAAVAAAIGAEPARISCTALREMIRGSIGAQAVGHVGDDAARRGVQPADLADQVRVAAAVGEQDRAAPSVRRSTGPRPARLAARDLAWRHRAEHVSRGSQGRPGVSSGLPQTAHVGAGSLTGVTLPDSATPGRAGITRWPGPASGSAGPRLPGSRHSIRAAIASVRH